MTKCHYSKFNCGDKLHAGYFENVTEGNPIKFFTLNMVWERTTSPVSHINFLDLTFNRMIVTTESGSQYYIILD